MSSDLRALGRLSESLDGGAVGGRRRRRVTIRRGPGPARRRPLVPRSVIVAVVVVSVALAWVGLAARGSDEAPTPPTQATEGSGVPVRSAGDEPQRTSRSDGRTLPGATFARVDDLSLRLPHAEPVLVAFGEADRAESLALQPVGRLTANEHHRFEPTDDTRGPDYVVLASTGKPRVGTSAVDVVVPAEAIVSAPVTGRVVGVREYAMEGGVRDIRVTIEAARRPSLHVVVVHLDQPTVAEGDEVQAGKTPLGVVRRLPFSRGVDAHLDEPLPHVHLEVKPAGEAAPPDPNEAAAAPDEDAAAGR